MATAENTCDNVLIYDYSVIAHKRINPVVIKQIFSRCTNYNLTRIIAVYE